jgi:hypothetical protein
MKNKILWSVYRFEDGKEISLNCPRLSNDDKYHEDKINEVISHANETGLDVWVSFEFREKE